MSLEMGGVGGGGRGAARRELVVCEHVVRELAWLLCDLIIWIY